LPFDSREQNINDYLKEEVKMEPDEHGWTQYSQKTLGLLRKKTQRIEKLKYISKEREEMKGDYTRC
jgi:hypothetical protein